MQHLVFKEVTDTENNKTYIQEETKVKFGSMKLQVFQC